ncbi:MAG: PEP/pyruvate-binding domain-containing protein [Actinomycetota bacterium]
MGGKAASLARLAAAGAPVPDFFVVTTRAFEHHLSHNGLDWPASDDPDPIEELAGRIARAPMPGVIHESISNACRALMRAGVQPAVAVRSSGAAEDSGPASFAGQFATVLGVSGGDVERAVCRCWASSLSKGSLAYRRSRGIPLGAGPSFAVVVQTQVIADKAGVLFTRHPLEPAGDSAYLEANFGTGESVVGGMVTPDSISVSRSTGRVAGSRIGSKKRMTVVSENEQGSRVIVTDPGLRGAAVLSNTEAELVVELGLRIEERMGQPQDIEWAFDGSGLWILQARPQTGLPG